jgi:hypothetical protein
MLGKILLAGVSADRYFLAPNPWVSAAAPMQPVSASALPETSWSESSIAPFMPQWATSDLQRAAVEMRSRINMKKEKRKRNRLNMLRYKKPTPNRWQQQRGGGSGGGAEAEADAQFISMVFTEIEAAAAAEAEAAR